MLIVKDNQYHYATQLGFVPLFECGLNVPHVTEARDLAKTLKAYDKDLEVGFLRAWDGEHRWVIRHRDLNGMEILVMRLENEDGSYRRPDSDVAVDVMKSDMKKEQNRRRLTKRIETSAARKKAKDAADRAEDVEAMTARAEKVWRDEINPGRRTHTAFIPDRGKK